MYRDLFYLLTKYYIILILQIKTALNEEDLDSIDVLLVDDDEVIVTTLERCLRRESFTVKTAHSGMQALQLLRRQVPKVMLLDVMMPGMDGYEVCREIRADKKLSTLPVIFLTAKTAEADHIAGFKAGGDDYINKPFNSEELVLRLRAMIRRTQDHKKASRRNKDDSRVHESKLFDHSRVSQPIIELKGFKLNILTFELFLPNEKKLLLTPIQFDLLFNFMTHPGDIFSPSALLSIIWDYPPETGSSDLVRVHIKNLRMRIEEDPACPAFIETIPGYGYTIRAES
jgi:DNA-binding response OmpR family regulator